MVKSLLKPIFVLSINYYLFFSQILYVYDFFKIIYGVFKYLSVLIDLQCKLILFYFEEHCIVYNYNLSL